MKTKTVVQTNQCYIINDRIVCFGACPDCGCDEVIFIQEEAFEIAACVNCGKRVFIVDDNEEEGE